MPRLARHLVAFAVTAGLLAACGGGGGGSSGPESRGPFAKATGLLNDTGISATQCHAAGDAQGRFVDCSSSAAQELSAAQDGSSGRDAENATNGGTDGKLGFSFTKIDFIGQALEPDATAWTCLRDEVTGLIWEIKAADGGLRDADRTYTNFSGAYDPQKLYGAPTDASGFVAAVNAAGLCGARDWRLPTAQELQGVVDYGAGFRQVAIDTQWFKETAAANHWASNPFTLAPPLAELSWMVSFDGGFPSWTNRSTPMRVRLVRAQAPIAPARWNYSSDGQEVTDNLTRLTWRRCPEGMTWSGAGCAGAASGYSYSQSLARARDQASATSLAWRVPNVKELFSLVDTNANSPAIDGTVFPGTGSFDYWTTTPYPTSPAMLWHVSFATGGAGPALPAGVANKLRLVRSAQ